MVNLSGFSVYKIVSFANDTNKTIFLPFQSGCLLFPFLPNFLDKNFQYNIE